MYHANIEMTTGWPLKDLASAQNYMGATHEQRIAGELQCCYVMGTRGTHHGKVASANSGWVSAVVAIDFLFKLKFERKREG